MLLRDKGYGQGIHTHRGMLEREGDGILHPLDGNRQRISGEAFADDNLDPADLVCGAPVTLA